MSLSRIATRQGNTIERSTRVLDAARLMKSTGSAALAVVDEQGTLVGVFSMQDLAQRVVLEERDPTSTVGQVMTRLEGVGGELAFEEAVEKVSNWDSDHIPVVDDDGRIVGMASVRVLLQTHADELSTELNSVVSFRCR